MTDYAVIELKEIYYEGYAGLLADFHRLIEKQKNRNDNRVTKTLNLLEEARYIWRNLLGNQFTTLKDMEKVKEKYKLMKTYIKELKSYA